MYLKFCGMLLLGMMMTTALLAQNQSLRLQWDAVQEADLLGYRVYWGKISGVYSWQKDMGKETEFVLSGLSMGEQYYFVVTALDYWGNESAYSRQVRGVVGDSPVIPDEMVLLPNYPNPFRPHTFIDFRLDENRQVDISIYNVRGRKIRNIQQARLEAGVYTVMWDGRDERGNRVAAGVYYCRMQTNDRTLNQKITLLPD
jgi:hypothetical protein